MEAQIKKMVESVMDSMNDAILKEIEYADINVDSEDFMEEIARIEQEIKKQIGQQLTVGVK